MDSVVPKTSLEPAPSKNAVVKKVAGKKRSKPARPRVREADFRILNYGDQAQLLERNYKKDFLKRMCVHYGLRVGGNKDQLQTRVYDFLKLSVPAVRIQRLHRHRLMRTCAHLRGPGYVNRGRAVNETDFFSMSSCSDIPAGQFISLRTPDGHIYAFEILSLSILFSRHGRDARNPYNRAPFPKGTYTRLRKLIRLARALGHTVVTRPPPPPVLSPQERSTALFHDIYLLGHYPSRTWFDDLSRSNAVRYVRELMDIWRYRAGLSRQTRQEICPPDGDPFRSITTRGLELRSEAEVKLGALGVMSCMVRDGVNEEMKKMGAYYVLCALTLVSPEAATEMPFLYAAVAE